MAQFNKVILAGHLVRDPELKQTNSGESVTTFSLAVNRIGKNGEVDFFEVTAWRKTAELVAQHLKKGRPVLVCGRLQNRTWTDKQGNKRTSTEIVADEVAFIDSRAAEERAAGEQPTQPVPPNPAQWGQGYTPSAYTPSQAPTFEALADDEDLPF